MTCQKQSSHRAQVTNLCGEDILHSYNAQLFGNYVKTNLFLGYC